MTSKETRDELFKKNDFNVFSMYRKSDTTQIEEVDSLMELAKMDFEKELEQDGLPKRSIGWFRADIETYPDLDMPGEGHAN